MGDLDMCLLEGPGDLDLVLVLDLCLWLDELRDLSLSDIVAAPKNGFQSETNFQTFSLNNNSDFLTE